MSYYHRCLFVVFAWMAGTNFSFCADGPNLMPDGNMEGSCQATVNPWGGVNDNNNIAGFNANSLITNTDGDMQGVPFPVSVGVGDLNGDGKPDIVMADPRGFFWFFPNSGTEKSPQFTHGEIIPIYLTGPGWGTIRGCNKVQLVDFDGDGLLDLVVGDAIGRIYLIKNVGSKTDPKFLYTPQPESVAIKLGTKGLLRGNYFTPFAYDWNGDGTKDLIWGDGTYSANSIFLALNSGSNESPRFADEGRSVLIRGMGKEHLTPQVIDWNGDGKPDIVAGERDGTISLYLNNSTDPKTPSFEPAKSMILGGFKSSGLSVPVFADINGDGLPDLFLCMTNGEVQMSLNTGTTKEPKFGKPSPIKGVQPYPQYYPVPGWSLGTPDRSVYEILRIVSANPKETLAFDPDFTPSPGANNPNAHALKVEFTKPKNDMFSDSIPLASISEDNLHAQDYVVEYHGEKGRVSLMSGKNYDLSFYHRGSGFNNVRLEMLGWDGYVPKNKAEGEWRDEHFDQNFDFTPGSTWSQFHETIHFEKRYSDPDKPVDFTFRIFLQGRGDYFYLDDVVLKETH